MQKTLKSIFIGYIKISKYLRVWVSRTHQVFIISKLIINKNKSSKDLLIEHLLPLAKKPFQLQINKLKPKSWPYKNIFENCLIAKPIKNGKANKRIYIKDIITKKLDKDELTQAIMQIKRIRIYLLCNSKPKTDLGGISDKNLLRNG